MLPGTDADLVIWPETAMPFYLAESLYTDNITYLAASDPKPTILTGAAATCLTSP